MVVLISGNIKSVRWDAHLNVLLSSSIVLAVSTSQATNSKTAS